MWGIELPELPERGPKYPLTLPNGKVIDLEIELHYPEELVKMAYRTLRDTGHLPHPDTLTDYPKQWLNDIAALSDFVAKRKPPDGPR